MLWSLDSELSPPDLAIESMSPISAGALELGALSPTHKHAKQEKTFVILNKLSERDTSKAAVEELYRWIKVIRPYCVGACGVLGSRMHLISERNDNKSTLFVSSSYGNLATARVAWGPHWCCKLQGLDEVGLTVLVSCLCATGTEQKTLARKVYLCCHTMALMTQ